MFADAVHHTWKQSGWTHSETGEGRSGRYLYNREMDTFAIILNKLGKHRTVRRYHMSSLDVGKWRHNG